MNTKTNTTSIYELWILRLVRIVTLISDPQLHNQDLQRPKNTQSSNSYFVSMFYSVYGLSISMVDIAMLGFEASAFFTQNIQSVKWSISL